MLNCVLDIAEYKLVSLITSQYIIFKHKHRRKRKNKNRAECKKHMENSQRFYMCTWSYKRRGKLGKKKYLIIVLYFLKLIKNI